MKLFTNLNIGFKKFFLQLGARTKALGAKALRPRPKLPSSMPNIMEEVIF